MPSLSVLHRYVLVGGEHGTRQAEYVFVSILCRSSNILGSALRSEWERMYTNGRNPLCYNGEQTYVFVRGDFFLNMSPNMIHFIVFTGQEKHRCKHKGAYLLSCWEALCAGKCHNITQTHERCLCNSISSLTLVVCFYAGVAIRSFSAGQKSPVPRLWVYSRCTQYLSVLSVRSRNSTPRK